MGIIQPDICHAGGITELKKNRGNGRNILRNSRAAQLQWPDLHHRQPASADLCIHNSLMQEIFLSSIGLYNEVLTQPIEVIDGHCVPPEGPGWGVDLKADILAKYPPKPFTPIESEPYVEF